MHFLQNIKTTISKNVNKIYMEILYVIGEHNHKHIAIYYKVVFQRKHQTLHTHKF